MCVCEYVKYKLFLGVQLLYNVLLFSAMQQSESVILTHIRPPFWIPFPFRSPLRIEQNSLCSTLGSHQLSILYIVVYTYVSLYLPIPFTTTPFQKQRHRYREEILKVKVKVTQSYPTLCDSQSPWNSPGQNTGVGRLCLLQGIFPTQGSNPDLLHCRRMLYQLSHKARLRTNVRTLFK